MEKDGKLYPSLGHYPPQEMRKWAHGVTSELQAHNTGLNWEGVGALVDQSSALFTLQLRVFLRAWPKLLKFPGSGSAEP